MWLSRRRRGENTNLSALFLSGGLRSRRAPLKKSPSPAAAPPHLAEPRSRRRSRRFAPCESPPAIAIGAERPARRCRLDEAGGSG